MYLGIDVGGTKTLMAAFSEAGHVEASYKLPTSRAYPTFLQDLTNALPNLPTTRFAAAGVAVPGSLDRQAGILTSAGNLDWQNKPVKADFEKLLHCPVAIENDAKAGGLAEAMNVKDEFKKVLFVTIGTGIGTALITNGVIDTEFGDGGGRHLFVAHQGENKMWEEFAAGPAIVKTYGKKASEITDQQAWKEIAYNLALGIVELVALTEPDVIVIGGGVGSHLDRFGAFLEQELHKYSTPAFPMPPIRPSVHPEEAVIYGCYELAKQLSNE